MIHEFSVYEDAETTTDRALAWLEDVNGEFFLWVHYMDPHRPYGMDLDDPTYTHPADESEIAELMSTAGVQPENLSDEQRRRIIDLYDSDIRYTATHMHRLFSELQDSGQWDELNVILTADHGEEFGDHGSYFHRNRPYDELIHVPLVVKRADGGDPNDETLSSVDEQRELLDVAPTICSFHGVSSPSVFEGEPLFEGDARTVFSTGSFNDDGQVVAVRDDGWKYIDVVTRTNELYNLSDDPKEQENLADQEAARCERLRSTIPQHLFESKPAGRPDVADVDEGVAQRLEELGYME
jgi:arylsulfatase A-like enzyme